ncbi:hypothetical protein SMC26_40240 [Actinomadura fulvescens]|uniref:Holin n=1 Tax=Actinomadura fulvescens TaxID=46160 RepID=A0ABN3Q6I4_9ACTN
MSDELTSLIRTYVPIAVGALVAWLATLGVEVDDATSTALVVGITGVATAGYYTLVRLAESRWPWVGKLLGAARPPSYRPEQEPKPRVGA